MNENPYFSWLLYLLFCQLFTVPTQALGADSTLPFLDSMQGPLGVVEHDNTFVTAADSTDKASIRRVTDNRTKAGDVSNMITIDIMVFYTNGMANKYPGSQMESRIQKLITIANGVFANSNVNARYNLVHSAEVTYPDNISTSVALNDLAYGRGVFADVPTLRNEYGADQVTLLMDYVFDPCYEAYMSIEDYFGNFAAFPYAVVNDGQKADGLGKFCPDTSFTAALGINLGLGFDKNNAGTPGYYDYSYGYQHPTGKFRTVMAWPGGCPGSCPEIPHFSNPKVNYEGDPTGIENLIDNARTAMDTTAYLAELKPTVEPEINLSLTEYNFNSVELQEVVSKVSLTVYNDGSGKLKLEEIGGNYAPFTVEADQCSNRTLDSGTNCIILLGLKPTKPGVFTTKVTINSNDTDDPTLQVLLSAEIYSLQPFIFPSSNSIEFKNIQPGEVVESSLIITNLGQQGLVLGQIEKQNDPNNVFSLSTDECSLQTLQEGDQCKLSVKYSPKVGVKTVPSTLEVTSNDPNRGSLSIELLIKKFPWFLFLPRLINN